jgi:outer membrane protein OmpA-like peptidoglycan-associated protein
MKMMKKIGLSAVLASTLVGAYAQEQETKIVEEFNPHFYVGGQFGAQYTLGELDFDDLISPNAQIVGGYNFTPVWGVRLGINAWQSKAGQTLDGVDYKWKWNYIAPNIDVTLNLSNLIAGFNPRRVVNVGIFAGVGANFAFNNDEAATAQSQLAYEGATKQPLSLLWEDSKAFFQGQFGANVDFRVSDHWSITLEAQANVLNDHYNSKDANNGDWYFNGLAGVKYNFGKTHRAKEVPVERCVPTERVVEKVVERVVEKPVPVEAPKQEEIRRDVFFVVATTQVSQAENVKVMEIVDFLKKNPNAKVEVTGYADRGTGNSANNAQLAERRAAAVVEALKKQGVDASRITSSSKGDTEQPFEVNELNRVSICVAK